MNSSFTKTLSLIAVFSVTIAAVAAETIIRVDATASPAPVNRGVFGHNIEMAGGKYSETGQGFWNQEAHRSYPEIVETVKGLGCPILRYPGGCMAHNFNWTKAVGPASERRKNSMNCGLDEYLELCEELGAEPMITVSDYVLPAAEMPGHASALVEYLNSPATPEHPWAMKRKEWGHPAPYGVKLFELGNESEHGNHGGKFGGQARRYTPSQYIDYAASVAEAMRKVDPSIKLGVVTKPGAGDDYDCPWNLEIYKRGVPIADFLVVHFYSPFDLFTGQEDYFKLSMAYGEKISDWMAQYRRCCKELGGRELPLAITEYNLGCGRDKPVPYRFSTMAGLLCSDMRRQFLLPESHVANAQYWQVLNGWWGMFTTKDGVIEKRRATLPFFELWGSHFDGALLKTEVEGAPVCEVPVAKGLVPQSLDILKDSRKVAELTLPPVTKCDSGRMGIDAAGVVSFSVDGLDKENYSAFREFGRPAESPLDGRSWLYKFSFEARFLSDDESARTKLSLGAGLNDARGYDAVKSGTGVMGAELVKDWTPFSCVLLARPDFPGGSLSLKLEDGSYPFNGAILNPAKGTLQLRNPKVELFTPPPPLKYQELTALASLSLDGKTLHLIVLNKSYDQTIDSKISLQGFAAKTAKSWTAFQEDVASIDYAAPIVKDMGEVGGDALKTSFRPHSMTVIDFHAK